MEPTLQEILTSNLQWVFVGGKGGVGKTTTSCALATLFANTPRTRSLDDAAAADGDATYYPRVLLVSTDPAHNLSDAFNQKIQKTPTLVNGIARENLFAMEIDPHSLTHGEIFSFNNEEEGSDTNSTKGNNNNNSNPFAALGGILKDAAQSLPGIDELTVFAEILQGVQQLRFDVILFDTAPTGHTLRLLALPQTLNSTMDKLMQLEGIMPMISAASQFFFSNAATAETPNALSSESNVTELLHQWKDKIAQVQAQFNDQQRTAFVCVCIAEFLSVYETDRLIQDLMKYNIGCSSIVVNQLVMKPSQEPPCRMCAARQKVQQKYLGQIDDLYDDFHVVKMPLLSDEVRGPKALQAFAKFLMEPYSADVHGYLDLGALC